MSQHTQTPVAAALTVAGLMTVLTASEATAQERITLETIGAVRMARFEEVRGATPQPRPAQATPTRDQAAGRTAKAR
ncbi:hypothetical protein MKK75_31480 [Methylobacterium sp. J-030]|uniref:hypothetical protein n=1 Tax=Methylobacterium sp. J-030 TaxID=2836627 RepID=UPI001FB94C8A|nr:hypothetical protein [Methylobacterium sp. J-030]MCJ2073256.1 hypothetical protein [Methylobacterium sp. J-030]